MKNKNCSKVDRGSLGTAVTLLLLTVLVLLVFYIVVNPTIIMPEEAALIV